VSESPEGIPPPLRAPDEAALRLAEAVVFASLTPVTARALAQLLPDDIDAEAVILALRERYGGRGIEVMEIGGGLRFRTAPDLAPVLRKVVQVPRRLPRVALETLAIVAYHQPVTRPEIEDIRGAGLSQQTLDLLLENDLITARGRKETPGRPTLWGTTPAFLEYFGLRDIRELPRRQDLLLETVRPEEKSDGDVFAGADGTSPLTTRSASGAVPARGVDEVVGAGVTSTGPAREASAAGPRRDRDGTDETGEPTGTEDATGSDDATGTDETMANHATPRPAGTDAASGIGGVPEREPAPASCDTARTGDPARSTPDAGPVNET
jgi:segregation and condensation protein B